MTERINLEVPATARALSTVRMVLGGAGARLDFSLDDIEDLKLAAQELLCAAFPVEQLERVKLEIEIGGGQVRLAAGPFRSPDLRQAVESKDHKDCLSLCMLLRSTADEVGIDACDTGYRVVIVKRRAETLE